MWAALRYRKGQAAALALLSALVTACAVFAPLYDRAMQQSLVDVKLDQATALDTAVRIQVQALAGDLMSAGRVPAPSDLLTAIPPDARDAFHPPVLGWSARADESPGIAMTLAGDVISRTAACEHVRIVDGRCPAAGGEILVSTQDAGVLGLEPGRTVDVAVDQADDPGPGAATTRPLAVVGTYEEIPGDDWFSFPLSGWSGSASDATPPLRRHDTWLTVDDTFTERGTAPLPALQSSASLKLITERVGVEELRRLSSLAGISRAPVLHNPDVLIDTQTALPALAATVASQVDDSHVLVPTILLPLGILCLVVLWLVLLTVTDLRRPEVAVARLRGQGTQGARRLLTGELMPAVLLGAVPGVLTAVGGAWLAARALPGDAGIELRMPVWLALAGVLAVLLATTLLAAARVARTPVDALVRRSSTVHRGWRLRALDAVLLTGCAVTAAAFVTGSLDGPAAFAAPALFALLVGLVLAHALTPLAAAGGRALLRRRAAGAALGLLDAARSQSLRSTVTVLTVATALAVFSVDAVLVAAHNRDEASRQEAGAPTVIDVSGTDLAAVEEALDQVGDPRATPVVTIRPPGAGGITTLAVRPGEFGEAALLAPGTLPADWARRISPDDGDPVDLTGRRLTVTVDGGVTGRGLRGDRTDATLGVDVVASRLVFHRELGALPASGTAKLTAEVPCADTCQLAAITLDTTVGASMNGSVTLSGVAIDGRPADLGTPERWIGYDDPRGGSLDVSATASGPLTLDVRTTGPQRVTATQAWFGTVVPALATRATPVVDGALAITGIDGRSRPATLAGTASRLPAAPARTVLTDLDLLQRASRLSTDARLSVWIGSADRGLADRVTQALTAQGLIVSNTRTLADVRRGYDESIPTWSVQLGVLTGLAALLVAVLMLGVAAVSGWRVRARDLASLWVGGVPRRTVGRLAVAAQLPTIALAVLAGAASGLVGATVSMPTVPLFAQAPEIDTLDLTTPWGAVVAVTAICLVLLTLVGAAAGRAVFRRAGLGRLKEGL